MSRYTFFKELGRGTFGIVYKAYDRVNNRDVAIKITAKLGRQQGREIEILTAVKNCEFCVHVEDIFFSYTNQLCQFFVFEYVPFTLREFVVQSQKIKDKGKGLLEIRKVMCKVLKGVEYLHALSIIHRDLKPENILIDDPLHPDVVKICDFGSAKIIEENNNPYVVTRYYRAPELIFGSTNYGCSIDVWAIGCIFLECFIGKPLFQADSDVDLFIQQVGVLGKPDKFVIKEFARLSGLKKAHLESAIENSKEKVLNKVNFKSISRIAMDLAMKMLDWNAKTRISAANCLKHEFFTGNV